MKQFVFSIALAILCFTAKAKAFEPAKNHREIVAQIEQTCYQFNKLAQEIRALPPGAENDELKKELPEMEATVLRLELELERLKLNHQMAELGRATSGFIAKLRKEQ